MKGLILSAAVLVVITVPALVLLTLLVYWTHWQRQRLEYVGWRIDLIDLTTGICLQRAFEDVLDIGRAQPSPPTRRQLYLAADLTMSRQQCRLLAKPEGVWLENLSQVNISAVNGSLVENPRLLAAGDYLRLGAREYYVNALTRL